MFDSLVQWLSNQLRVSTEQVVVAFRRMLMVLAAAGFMLLATLVVAFDSIFVGFNDIATLEVGDLAPRDIFAPPNADEISFTSQVLTEDAINEVLASVQPVYDPADPEFAREQSILADQILQYIDAIRANPFDSLAQKSADIDYIIDLTLDETVREAILQLPDERWSAIKDEVVQVLLRVMRQDIRPAQLQNRLAQIPAQVSPSFSQSERDLIVAIVRDLVRANTFINEAETQIAQDEAIAGVEPQTRRFAPGQIIVQEREPIDERVYEALQALGLLNTTDNLNGIIGRALLASVIVFMVSGLYVLRFAPMLYARPELLSLVMVLFLLMLAAARVASITDTNNMYLFPSATLALVCVAIAGSHVAVIATLGLALLMGISAGDSLQVTVVIATSGIVGVLGVQRAERLNSFFVAGGLVAVMEFLLVILFGVISPTVLGEVNLATLLVLTTASGLFLVPAAAIAIMYVVTMLFNLPTVLRLIDLSQPSKPLLQRMLREAPGTYQHSLQVANLAEQAANAIGADAQLTHVSALYHDIGKMLNPLFFTENQQNIGNPHDTLNDPYRSADIIIGHVTEGDELARQYRLPHRVRDFIREHHGTTQVFVFYKQAINRADGNEGAVDIGDFTYPGPRPQSKETAILMLADSCEAATRSVQPNSKEAISDLVGKIFNDKREKGQLDDSNLTLNDLRVIQDIFVDILQGMFHPRIKYDEAIKKESARSQPAPPPVPPPEPTAPPAPPEVAEPVSKVSTRSNGTSSSEAKAVEGDTRKTTESVQPIPTTFVDTQPLDYMEIEDEEPLSEVPRLPSIDERRSTTVVKPITAETDSDTTNPENDNTDA